jgi:FHS family glucose/mannose:H+ symporter-like MFS transporter
VRKGSDTPLPENLPKYEHNPAQCCPPAPQQQLDLRSGNPCDPILDLAAVCSMLPVNLSERSGSILMASAAEQQSYSAENRRLILAGQIAFLPTGILTTLLGPMLPILIARWALNDSQAGKLFLVQFFASLVGVQLSGILLARAGFRPAFLLGLVLMACGVTTLYVGSPWLGMASVAVYGLGLGCIIPTDNLMIAELSPNSRAAAVSLLNFYWGVGAVLCSLLVAWSQAHKLLPVFLGGVAVFLLLLAAGVRNLPFPKAVKSADSPIQWREIWKNPAFWLFAVVFFLYPGAETAVGGWIGSYVTRMSAGGVTMGSMMPAFFWSALMVGRASAGVVLRLMPERRVLQVGFASGTAGIALMLRSATLPGVIASALITGLSFAILYPITVARLSHHFGAAARNVGPVMFSLAAVGPALMPWTVGVISNATGNLRAGLAVPLAATAILFLIHLKDW